MSTMDRNLLYKKREKLKKERELQDRLSLIKDVTDFLDIKNIPHGIEFEDNIATWISGNFPLNFSSIDWDKTIDSNKLYFVNLDQRNKIISSALSESLSPDDLVTVSWSNALKPSIEVRAEVVNEYPAIFADEDFDMWVIHCDLKFCLECYHEGYVGYKKSS